MPEKKMTYEEKRAERKEKSILGIMTTCVHFTGIHEKNCKAGVVYHEQFGSADGCFANIPCVQAKRENLKSCPSVKYPTREEAEKEQQEREEEDRKATQAINSAHADAKAKGLKEGHGGQGSIKCPLCPDGTISYVVASYNGHMSGGCSSGCISWME